MKDFGPTQTIPVTEHPSLFRPWEWGRSYQPNRDPMWHWAAWRLDECMKECSLMAGVRLDLREAKLRDANLINADLSHANLIKADLRAVQLRGATLRGVTLTGADLRGAVGLTQAQLDQAFCGDKVKLDPGLTVKSHAQNKIGLA